MFEGTRGLLEIAFQAGVCRLHAVDVSLLGLVLRLHCEQSSFLPVENLCQFFNFVSLLSQLHLVIVRDSKLVGQLLAILEIGAWSDGSRFSFDCFWYLHECFLEFYIFICDLLQAILVLQNVLFKGSSPVFERPDLRLVLLFLQGQLLPDLINLIVQLLVLALEKVGIFLFDGVYLFLHLLIFEGFRLQLLL